MWKHENETPRERYARLTLAFGGNHLTEKQMDADPMLQHWDDWYEKRDLGRPYDTKRSERRTDHGQEETRQAPSRLLTPARSARLTRSKAAPPPAQPRTED